MPTRRRNQPEEPYRSPRLTKPPEEVIRLIDERIRLGRDLSQSLNPMYNASLFVGGVGIEDLRNRVSNWSDFNVAMLRKVFDTAEVASDYSGVFIGGWGSAYDSVEKKLRRLQRSVDDHISHLEGIIDKVRAGLFDVAAERGHDATAATASPNQRMPSSAVYNIGTVGAMNTGEVHGNIDARVAAINLTSPDEFRAALAEVRKAFSDLPAEARNDALDVVDHAETVGDQPPAERRLGVLRTALTALPDSLAISARALEAWDRYGPVIRAHLGI